ncbi:BnaUnng03280D [Brassica napus]|uniref:BnaUnng03280D protein n=1 Tax=Brassica napus TaxID=3708 RepID=A0A078JRY8_BRANA|nr:BnaUnng03280D [Brassica napus]
MSPSFGCSTSIAVSSVASEWVKVSEVLTINNAASAKHLRLPPVKLHYSMLAEDAIKSAVKNYKKNKAFSDPAVLILELHLILHDFPPWTVLSGGCWPALRFWDSGNIKKNEEFMAWVVSLRTFSTYLHTYLSKLTDKLGSCSDYGLYTDFEKMAGIQKKEGVDCRSSHLHIQGQ